MLQILTEHFHYLDGKPEDEAYIKANGYGRGTLQLIDITNPQNGPVFWEIYCQDRIQAEGCVYYLNMRDKDFEYRLIQWED